VKLTAPRQVTFWIAVAFGVLSIVFKVVHSLWLLGLAGWFAIIAFFILAAGNLLEDL
jgi:hypothetical protein